MKRKYPESIQKLIDDAIVRRTTLIENLGGVSNLSDTQKISIAKIDKRTEDLIYEKLNEIEQEEKWLRRFKAKWGFPPKQEIPWLRL